MTEDSPSKNHPTAPHWPHERTESIRNTLLPPINWALAHARQRLRDGLPLTEAQEQAVRAALTSPGSEAEEQAEP